MSSSFIDDNLEFFSAGDAARKAGVTRDYVGRLCREGKVECRRVGRMWYVNRDSLNYFLELQNAEREKRNQDLSHALAVAPQISPIQPSAGLSLKSSRPAVVEALVRSANKRVAETTDSASQAATYAVGAYGPSVLQTSDAAQRLVALVGAFVLVFGVYGLVNAQYANFVEDSTRRMAHNILRADDVIADATRTFYARKEVQFAAAGVGSSTVDRILEEVRLTLFGIGSFVQDVARLGSRQAEEDQGSVSLEVVPLSPEEQLVIQETNNYSVVEPQDDTRTDLAIIFEQNIQEPPTTIVQQPVVERVVERVVEERVVETERVIETERVVTEDGLSPALLITSLQELENKLRAEIVRSFDGGISNTYTVISQLSNIDKLTNVDIRNSQIENSTISGSTISGVSLSLTSALGVSSGGTGTSTTPSFGQVLVGDGAGGYNLVATSTLGIIGAASSPGGSDGNLQYNNAGVFGGAATLYFDDGTGYVGIGTTTPYVPLAVSGEVVADSFTATTTATSTFPALSVTGLLYDGSGTGGVNGYVLQTTGSGVQWVATSSLGISGGGGTSSFGQTFEQDGSGALVPTTTTGVLIAASSTVSNLTSLNATVTNATTTSLFSSFVNFTSGVIASLTATDAIITRATSTNATTTNFAISGSLNDGVGTPGTNGFVLQTTGTGVQWVSTSSLGISGGGSSNFGQALELDASGNLAPTTTVGLVVSASSTISDLSAERSTTTNATTTNLAVTGGLSDGTNFGTNGFVLQTTGTGVQWVATSSLGISGGGSSNFGQAFELDGSGALAPTTTTGVLITSSSTITDLTTVRSTTTNATTTNLAVTGDTTLSGATSSAFAITSLTDTILSTDASGNVVATSSIGASLLPDLFLRNDQDDTTTGTLTAAGFTTTGTSTAATTTATAVDVNSDVITDFTGTGLSLSGGALTLDATGDWTGTFDGQEGSYYLNANNLTDFGTPFYTFFSATTTDALTEGSSNFYYTTNRFASDLAGTTTDALTQGATNLYYSTLLFATDLAGTTTDALSEGSNNLYFTNQRVDDRINASSTILTINTEAGLEAFLSGVTNVFTNNDTITDANIANTLTITGGSIDGTPIGGTTPSTGVFTNATTTNATTTNFAITALANTLLSTDANGTVVATSSIGSSLLPSEVILQSEIDTSSELAGIVTDETGDGALVFANDSALTGDTTIQGVDITRSTTTNATTTNLAVTGSISVPANSIDISDDTNLVAGSDISLSGDTLNVDDSFLRNDADDTTTGTLTAAGFTTTGTSSAATTTATAVDVNSDVITDFTGTGLLLTGGALTVDNTTFFTLADWYATTTDALTEGSTNFYYTTNRFASDLAGTTTDALTQGATNRYYSTLLFATDLAGTTTDALSEGSNNLYWTQTRFDTALAGTTTLNNLAILQGLTDTITTRSTTTNATTTNFAITGTTNAVLATDGNGVVISTTTIGGDVIADVFLRNDADDTTSGSLTATEFIATDGAATSTFAGAVGIGTTSPFTALSVVGEVVATNFTATTTASTSTLPVLTGTRIAGFGLAECADAADKLIYNNGTFSCGADAGAGGGITALGAAGQLQSGASQTFATSSDTNIGITIVSSGDTHTFTSEWFGTLAAGRGGTGISSPTAAGVLLGTYGGGDWQQAATSSLGLPTFNDLTGYLTLTDWYGTTTDAIAQGSTNLYYATTLFATDLAGTTTDALSEGSTNLYWTQARFDTALAATTTLNNVTTLLGLTDSVATRSTTTNATTTNFAVTGDATFSGDTTISGATVTRSTTTNATTTNLAITGGLSDGTSFGTDGFVLQTDGSSVNWVATTTLGLGGGGIGAGTQGQLPFYNGSGSTLTATSSIFLTQAGAFAVGTTTASSSLTVYGDIFAEGSNRYFNFGTSSGEGGYGIRDNNGQLEFKNISGGWDQFTVATTAGPSFSVEKSSNQNILDDVETQATWETENFDTFNNFDLSTERFTPTVPGKYILTASALFDDVAASAPNVILYIRKNGAHAAEARLGEPDENADLSPFASVIVDANGTTDYFDVALYYADGGLDPDIDVVSGTGRTYFTGAMVTSVTPTGGGFDDNGALVTLTDNTDFVGLGTSSPFTRLGVDGDVYIAGNVTATGTLTVSATSTAATTTATAVDVNSDVITDFTGTGLSLSGGALTLDATGDWTGTFDGQEGSYYLNANNLTDFGTPFYTFFSATTTDALTEGSSNFYYTTNRFASDLAGTTTDALTQGATNLYYSTLLFATDLAGTTTDALSEGSNNLYFTNQRVDDRINASSTILTINTEAGLEAFLSGVTNVFTNNDTITDANIANTLTITGGSIDGTPIGGTTPSTGVFTRATTTAATSTDFAVTGNLTSTGSTTLSGATSSAFAITSLTNALLSTDGSGNVVSTTTIGGDAIADIFLRNDADDTTTGTLTAAGFTTTGTSTAATTTATAVDVNSDVITDFTGSGITLVGGALTVDNTTFFTLADWYATTTDALTEGSTNFYYTTNRFASDLAGTTTDALTQGATNRYYSTLLFATDLAGTTTDALSEGSNNLYWTQTRFDTALAGTTTLNNLAILQGLTDAIITRSTTTNATTTNLSVSGNLTSTGSTTLSGATSSAFAITSLTDTILSTDASGNVVATSSIGASLLPDLFLRNDQDDTTTGTLTAAGFTTTGTSTAATTTATAVDVNSDVITDFTGTGLSLSGGALTLDATGDWTGTFDGQEGSYYLNANNLTDFGTPFYTFFSATTTDALTEGSSNFYYTTNRFASDLAGTTTDALTQGATNLYYSTLLFATDLAGTTTDALSEGSNNLYFTNQRVDDRINASSTILTINTEAGLEAFLSGVTNVFTNNDTITDANIANTLTITGGSIDGTPIGGTTPSTGVFTNATTTNATTTNFAITSLTSTLLQTNGLGGIIAAVAGVDYALPGTSPFGQTWSLSGGVLSPTTTVGVIISASSTLSDVTIINATTTNGTTTNFAAINASTTNLTVSNNLTLTNGLGETSGGTGQTAYATGDILYSDSSNSLARLPVSTNGLVLKLVAGVPSWQPDLTTGGGGGAGAWSTTTDSLAVYPTDTSDVIIIGASVTSTVSSIFEVSGQSYFSSNVGIGTTSPGSQLSVVGDTYLGGDLTATGTTIFTGDTSLQAATATNFAITSLTSTILSVDGSGTVVATSSIGNNFLPSTLIFESEIDTSSELAGIVTDETGDGALVFANDSALTGDTTIQGVDITRSTTTNATTTNLAVTGDTTLSGATSSAFAITSLTDTILSTDASGNVVATSSIGASLLPDLFLRNDQDDTTTGTLTAAGFTTTGTSTAATTTATAVDVNSDVITDFTGTGLSLSGGALTLDATGDWTGTFDGQEGSYYLNANNLTDFGTPFYTFFSATTTDALTEGSSNFYYTTNRFASDLAGTTTDALTQGATNLYYSTLLFATDLAGTTTDALSEGSNNLYFTNQRVDDRINASSTILTINTEAGLEAFLSGVTNVFTNNDTITDANIANTLTITGGSIDGTPIGGTTPSTGVFTRATTTAATSTDFAVTGNLTSTGSTTLSGATSSAFAITSLTNALLSTDGSGNVVSTTTIGGDAIADIFLRNDADDTTTGTLTAAGFTTTGTSTAATTTATAVDVNSDVITDFTGSGITLVGGALTVDNTTFFTLADWYATTTDALTEGSTNFYYTTNRFASDLAGTTTDALTQGATNRYYSTLLFATDLAGTTTDALSEGSNNLYWTQTRFDTALAGTTTLNNLAILQGLTDAIITRSTTTNATTTNLSVSGNLTSTGSTTLSGATSSAFAITSLTDTILSTDASGNVVATSSIGASLLPDLFLRNDQDDTTTGTLTAAGFTTTGTSTAATTTATAVDVNSDVITDFTGTGLSLSGGALTLDATGDWTGTFDGQEGSYYLNANNLTDFGTPFYTFFSATTTDALTEGSSNFYYTTNRFASDLAGTTTDALTQGATNLYYSTLLFATDLAGTTTDALSEGSNNLYFTNQRVDDRINASSTILTINTEAGLEAFLSGVTNVFTNNDTITDANIANTLTITGGSIDGTPIGGTTPSTGVFTNATTTNATTTNFAITALANTLLSTDANGTVVATSSIGSSLLPSEVILQSEIDTSSELAGIVTDETGDGALVFANDSALTGDTTIQGVDITRSTTTNATTTNLAVTGTISVPANSIDISSDTNLVAGSDISLSGDTLNVDDSFLRNDADDTTTGTLTAAGFTTTGTSSAATTTATAVDVNSDVITDFTGTGLLLTGGALTVDNTTFFTLADWYATTTDGLAEGSTNFYYTENRFTASLGATTTVGSITSLPNLATVGTIGSGVWQGSVISDTYVSDALSISGGSIDNTPIGQSTPRAGAFTFATTTAATTTNFAITGALNDGTDAGTNGEILQTTGTGISWVATSSLGFSSGVSAGTQGQLPFYNGSGSTLTATSSIFLTQAGAFAVGTTTASSSLTVYGDIFAEGSNRYFNFGTSSGEGGYGIRDNNGQLEFKNISGGWDQFTVATTAGPSFSVHKNGTDQSYSGFSDTKVTWDGASAHFDTNNNFDDANDRFVPSVPGKYILTASLEHTTLSNTSFTRASIYKNGLLYKAGTYSPSGGGNTGTISNVTAVVDANGTTDYFEIYIYSAEVGTETLLGASTTSHFSGAMVTAVAPTGGGWDDNGALVTLTDNTDQVGIGTSSPFTRLGVDGDVYVAGNVTATGTLTVSATSTAATSSITAIDINSDVITDFTGTGLLVTGGALNVDSGTFFSLSDWYATTTDALTEGATNRYYSTTLFATDLAGTTTDALSEGSTNFYYTENRFTASLGATTTVGSITSLPNLATVGTIGSGVWQGSVISDTYVSDALSISGGSIDNTPIGQSTPRAGAFTFATTTAATTTNLSVSENLTSTGSTTLSGATSSAFAITSLTNALLSTDGSGNVVSTSTLGSSLLPSEVILQSEIDTSSELAGIVTDETGDGALVFANDSALTGDTTIQGVDITRSTTTNATTTNLAVTGTISVPANSIDISSDTNLVAGSDISLSGDTLNVDDSFLRNDADDTTTGTLTAAGFTTTGTSTAATTTATAVDVNSDVITDFTGTGLSLSGGALTLDATGDWTGTFDGQEGSYYLNANNLTDFGTPFYTFFSATTTDALTEGSSNFYYTTNRFASDLAGTTTDALSEGSNNLYWTQTRFDAALGATTTVGSITSLPNLATVGTVSTGVWQGTAVANSFVADDLTITGGVINNTPIGQTTPNIAAFTLATTTAATTTNLAITSLTNTLLSTDANGTVVATSTIGGDAIADIFLRNDADDTTTGTLTAAGFTTTGTSTAATTTATAVDVNSDVITDFTGTGLSLSGGALTLDATGDWTGTFDGQEGSYYLNANNLTDFGTPFYTFFSATTTDALTEGSSNFYYTTNRFASDLAGTTTDALTQGATNLYYSTLLFATDLAGTTTDALSEGSNNLYFTNQRVDDRINASSTILTINTEAGLEAFLSGVTNVFTNNDTITDANIANTLTITGGSIDGTPIGGTTPSTGVFTRATTTAATSTDFAVTGNLTSTGSTTLSGATSSAFAITSLTNALLSTDGSGNVVSTTTIGGDAIADIFLRNDADDTTSGSLTATEFIATDGAATSTFAGGLTVQSSALVVQDGSGNVGIGTTTPFTRLSIGGDAYIGGNVTATGTLSVLDTATSTIPALSVTGRLYDGAGTGGADGFVLQSDGTNINWVATSSLGIASGLNGAGAANRVAYWSGADTLTSDASFTFDGVTLSTPGDINLTDGSSIITVGGNSAFFASSTGEVTAGGIFAGDSITTGTNNTAFGSNALTTLSTGASNTAVGQRALFAQTGSNSTAIGMRALNAATGDGNIGVGYRAGENLTSGANNIVIGTDINIPVIDGNNQLNIGNLLYGTGLDGTNDARSSGNIGIGTTTPFSKFSLAGSAYIGGDLTATGTVNIALTNALLSTDGSGNVVSTSTLGSSLLPSEVILQSEIDTSSELAGIVTDETGDGALVFANDSALTGDTTIQGVDITRSTTTNATTTNLAVTGTISVPANSIDISSDTNLVAGSDISLSGDTLNVDDSFLRNDADDTTTGTLTAAGFTTTGTSTAATTTATAVDVNSDVITDFTGTGLSLSGGALTLDATGDWTGTFDGQEGSYYLNANNLTDFGTPFYTFFSATTTDALTEGSSNFYYTTNRFASDLAGTTTDALTQGATNLYYSTLLFATDLAGTTTDALSEGSNNLYFTNQRVDDRINASSTILTINTEAGLEAFLSGVTNVFTNNDTITDANIANTLTITGGSIDGTPIGGTTPSTGVFTNATTTNATTTNFAITALANTLLSTDANGTVVATSTIGGDAIADIFLRNDADDTTTGTITAPIFNASGASTTLMTFSDTLFMHGSSTGLSVGLGHNVLESNATGTRQTALGYQALQNSRGGNNTAIGAEALLSNTWGTGNLAFGSEALRANTTGLGNVAIGNSSLWTNQTGIHNVAIGELALFSNVSGYYNVGIGRFALNDSIGWENTAVGFAALANTIGSGNTGLGYDVLGNIVSGDNNIAIGELAGESQTAGSKNIIIGNDIDLASTTGSNQLNIGNIIFGTNIDGTNSALSSGNIGVGTTTPFSKLSIAGSAYIGGNLTATGTLSVSGDTTLSGATSSAFAITSLTNALLGADASGNVVSTTTIGSSLLPSEVILQSEIDTEAELYGILTDVTEFLEAGDTLDGETLALDSLSYSGTIDDAQVNDVLTVSGGTINNTPIGQSTPNVGAFTLATTTAATSTDFAITGALNDGTDAGTNGEILQTTGTGISWVATSSLGFSSGVGAGTQGQLPFYNAAGSQLTATSSIFLSQAGNFGIGDPTPDAFIDVEGSASDVYAAHFINSNADAYGIYGYVGNADTNRFALDIESTAGNIFRLTNAGNLGIGTSTPFSRFSVAGDAYIGGNLTATGTLTISGDTSLQAATTTNFAITSLTNALLSTDANGTVVATTTIGASLLPDLFLRNDADDTTSGSLTATEFIATDGAATSTFAGGLTVQSSALVVQDGSGNVGIGTTTPSRTFTVQGSMNVGSTENSAGLTFQTNGLTGEILGIDNENNTYNPITLSAGASPTLYIGTGAPGNVGIGTTTPPSVLTVAHATDPDFRIASNDGTEMLRLVGSAGVNYIQSGLLAQTGSAAPLVFSNISAGAEWGRFDTAGNFGVGTTTPWKRLSVQETVADAQFSVAYDGTRYANFQVDSAGDLVMDVQGDDAYFTDENLWVCTGGSCPSGTPTSGNGNLIVESRVGIGTTTPQFLLTIEGQNGTDDLFQIATTTNQDILVVNNTGDVGVGTSTPSAQLAVEDLLFVGASGATSLGTATSTFQGDIRITGKLDVGTIDPVYKIDGIKYATFGHSMIGVKEEVVTKFSVKEYDADRELYKREINFTELEKGTDLWLFYQITEFGEDWEKLIVSLTPAFDGRVFYEEEKATNTLVIYASEAGNVSARLVADRFDADKWPNLRPDQDDPFTNFELESK